MESSLVLISHDADQALQPFLDAVRGGGGGGAGGDNQQGVKTTSDPSVCRAIVLRLLSDPDIFAGYDQVKAAVMMSVSGNSSSSSSEQVVLLANTLDLFSYGAYQDYAGAMAGSTKQQQRYLTLTDGQIYKLRQLTVMSLVERAFQTKRGSVSYQDIAQQCDLLGASGAEGDAGTGMKSDDPAHTAHKFRLIRAVEELVLSCLHARVVTGQLCQKTMRLVLVPSPAMAMADSSTSAATATSTTTTTTDSTFGQSRSCYPRDVHPTHGVRQMIAQIRDVQQQIVACSQNMTTDTTTIQHEMSIFDTWMHQVELRKKTVVSASAGSAASGAAAADNSKKKGSSSGGGFFSSATAAGGGLAHAIGSMVSGGGGGGRSGRAASAAAAAVENDRMEIDDMAAAAGGAVGGGGGSGGQQAAAETTGGASSTTTRRQKRSRGGFGGPDAFSFRSGTGGGGRGGSGSGGGGSAGAGTHAV